MKKLVVFLLASLLVVAVVGGPAAAGKKKKKQKPPPVPVTQTITFEEEGTTRVPAPHEPGRRRRHGARVRHRQRVRLDAGDPGPRRPRPRAAGGLRDGNATLTLTGSHATRQYDYNVYLYDSGCNLMEPYIEEGADASGAIPAGAQWAVVDMVMGAEGSFKLTATNTITILP